MKVNINIRGPLSRWNNRSDMSVSFDMLLSMQIATENPNPKIRITVSIWKAQIVRGELRSHSSFPPPQSLLSPSLSFAVEPWFLHYARLELSPPFPASHSPTILLPPLFPLQRFRLYGSLLSQPRFLSRDIGAWREWVLLRTCRPLKTPCQLKKLTKRLARSRYERTPFLIFSFDWIMEIRGKF